jgi:hypothetical protein
LGSFQSGKSGSGPRRPDPRGGSTTAATAHDARAVATYLAEMSGQLETMARAARLDLLGYLLSMARAEAETQARDPDNETH